MRGKKLAALLVAAVCLTAAEAGGRLQVQATEAPREAEDSQLQETEDARSQEGAWPAGPALEGDHAILMEADSGTVLYEKNAHEQGYPASITKIATAIVAIENGDFNDEVTFSADAVFKTEGSGIWRDVDEVMTLEQCMYALMLESANECAYAIAEHVGGDYGHFVDMMNEKAAELGCTGTHFNNPHGLPDEQHLTTCYDMALISSYAIQNDTFRQIVGTVRYDIPPTNKHEETTYLTNHHRMIKQSEQDYYEPCIGGKTGYTTEAGNTLVTFAQKNGLTLVCVVLKESKASQYADTRLLLDWGFENFGNYNISEYLEASVEGKPENGFLAEGGFAGLDPEAVVTLPQGVAFTEAAWETLAEEKDPLVAGTIQFSYGGRVVGNADIAQAAQEPESYPFQETQQASGSREPSKTHLEEGTDDQPEQEPDAKIQEKPDAGAFQEKPDAGALQETPESSGVNPWIIAGIVLGVIALGALGFGIYKFADDFHRIRYLWSNRRGGGMRKRILERKVRKRHK